MFEKHNHTSAQNFGAVVRPLRAVQGWTQQDLATRAGLTKKRVSQIEQGKARLRASEIDALKTCLPGLSDILDQPPVTPRPRVLGVPVIPPRRELPPPGFSAPEALASRQRETAPDSPVRHTTVADLPEFCRVPEVAQALACSPGAVRLLIKAGKLAHIRVGRLVRISRESLIAYIAEQTGQTWRSSAPTTQEQTS